MFRKVFGFKTMYMNLFRRSILIEPLFYFLPYLSCILVERLVMNAIFSPHMHSKGSPSVLF